MPGGGYNNGDPRNWCAQYQILPYMENTALYNNRTQLVGVKSYMCPGRGRNTFASTGGNSPGLNGPYVDYALNGQSFDGVPNPTTVQLAGTPSWAIKRVTMSGITNLNGTSNTVMLGEKSIQTDYYQNTYSWGWDECIFSGGYGGTNRWSWGLGQDLILKDSPNNNGNNNYWGSPFEAGGLFVMCDGQVRTIGYSLSGSLAFHNSLDYRNTVPVNLNQ
jgi:hypothetical protein